MEFQENIRNENVKRLKKAKDYHIMARSLFKSYEYAKSLEYYNNSIQFNPNNSDIYSERAECFFSLNNKNYFIRDLTFAIITNACKDIKYWENRVKGYSRIGEQYLAERDLELIKKLFNVSNIDELKRKLIIKNTSNAKAKVNTSSETMIDWGSFGDSDNLLAKLKHVFDATHEGKDENEENYDLYKYNKLNISKFKFLIIKLINTPFADIYKVFNEKFDEIDVKRIPVYDKLLNDRYETIESPELFLYYIQKFGKQSMARHLEAYKKSAHILDGKDLEIYDWGAGYNFSTSLFVEFLKSNSIRAGVSKFNIIDPSILTSYLQLINLKLFNRSFNVKLIPKKIADIKQNEFVSNPKSCKVHFISNIFDNEEIDFDKIADIISHFKGMNLFICTSSNKNSFLNMEKFYHENMDRFKKELIANNEKDIQSSKWQERFYSNIIAPSVYANDYIYENNPWTRKEIIFYSNIR